MDGKRRLLVTDLNQINNQYNEIEIETYKSICRAVERSIALYNSWHYRACTFNISTFTVGRPLCNLSKAKQYLHEYFSESGFLLYNTNYDSVIYISWYEKSPPKRIKQVEQKRASPRRKEIPEVGKTKNINTVNTTEKKPENETKIIHLFQPKPLLSKKLQNLKDKYM